MENFDLLLYSLGSIGLFSSRAFLPAFLTALTLKYGADFPILNSFDFVKATGNEPSWFTHDFTIMALGILSAAEMAGDKVPEIKQSLNQIFVHSKPAIAALNTMGVLSATDMGFINETIQHAGFFDIIQSAAVGFGVFLTSSSRESFMSILAEADEDDELGIQGIISWLDDFWATFGTLIIIVFPLLIAAITLGIFLYFRRLARKAREREQQSRVPCGSCKTEMYQSAIECPSCHQKNPSIKALSWMGNTIDQGIIDLKDHKFDLLKARRCPVCATRLEKRKTHQECPTCKHESFNTLEERELFLSNMGSRVPGMLLLSFLLGLIPIMGMIIGIILFRIRLVSPFRRYIPLHKSFFIKWFIRFFFFILMILQIIPILGGFVMPVMALISYNTYKNSFKSSLK
jgi:Zn finger protein HypA/HybF involved in hydrogenase expression